MHSICRSRPPGTLVSPTFSCYSYWYVSEIGYNNNLSKTLQRVWSNMIVVDVSKDNRETSWTQAERANGCQPSTTVYATPSDRSTRYGYECIAVDRVYPSANVVRQARLLRLPTSCRLDHDAEESFSQLRQAAVFHCFHSWLCADLCVDMNKNFLPTIAVRRSNIIPDRQFVGSRRETTACFHCICIEFN